MGTFIVNTLKYNNETGYFELKGGSSNIVPRPNAWSNYDNNEYLLKDLISGCIKLNCTNRLSIKCKEAVSIIERKWEIQFGERNNSFGGTLSINPYSLYQISCYYHGDKNEALKYKFDVNHISDDCKISVVKEGIAMKNVWDEGVSFYKEQVNFFFNYIGINNNN